MIEIYLIKISMTWHRVCVIWNMDWIGSLEDYYSFYLSCGFFCTDLHSNLSILSVPEEGHSRNASCALN